MITKVFVRFDKLKGETSKAYLLQFMNEEHWLPKKLCWNFTTNKKLGGNCTIPAWLYEKIFGHLPEESEATEIITTHVPEQITVKPTEPDAKLIR